MAAPRCGMSQGCPNEGDEPVEMPDGRTVLACFDCIAQVGDPVLPPSTTELAVWAIVATVGLVGGIWLATFGTTLLVTEIELDPRVMAIRWLIVASGTGTAWISWRLLRAMEAEKQARS